MVNMTHGILQPLDAVAVERSDKTLQYLPSFLTLLTFCLYFAFCHKTKDPATKWTSDLESQGMITYTPVVTFVLRCVWCTSHFQARYSSSVCHASRDFSTLRHRIPLFLPCRVLLYTRLGLQVGSYGKLVGV